MNSLTMCEEMYGAADAIKKATNKPKLQYRVGDKAVAQSNEELAALAHRFVSIMTISFFRMIIFCIYKKSVYKIWVIKQLN